MKRPMGVFITDTHLSKDNIDEVEDIFEQACIKCLDLKIKNLFHLGDFFTNRTAQPLSVLKSAQRIINNLIGSGISTHVIPGNHDKNAQDANESYLDIYHQDGFNVHDDAGIFYNDSKVIIYCIPFYKESSSVYLSKLEKIVSKLNNSTINILVTHVAISGVRNNDGAEVKNDIPLELFNKFDKVLVGHYHDQSQVGDNVFYIGSARPQNFGENNSKGITLLFNDGSHEFMKLDFKEYHKQVIDINDLSRCEFDADTYKNHHVRLIVKGDSSKIASFNKSLIPDWIDYKFETEEPLTYDQLQDKIVCHDKSSIRSSFDEFIVLNNIENIELHNKYIDKL